MSISLTTLAERIEIGRYAARREDRTGPQHAAREEGSGPAAPYREELLHRACWKIHKSKRKGD